MCHHGCSFTAAHFYVVMDNLIRNPNIQSSWLFRADILHESGPDQAGRQGDSVVGQPPILAFEDLVLDKVIVRKMIPRNTKRDCPLDQSCVFYKSPNSSELQRTLFLYLPHVTFKEDIPFYHPQVRGVAYLHEWNSQERKGKVSVHYALYPEDVGDIPVKLRRTALNLLTILHKHGEGESNGYVKRVHHDLLVPQVKVQDRYQALKSKYSRKLIDRWLESTDPVKHVFEDLCIAAFLIELWAGMYRDDQFPGFVDIGCGNGLLAYILSQEGYRGWGFDARRRRSWGPYNRGPATAEGEDKDPLEGNLLKELLLLPSLVTQQQTTATTTDIDVLAEGRTHNGLFPKGTFIISNHADELTPWTPVLATLSQCPFIAIPCCSHNLAGAKYRAPPPKDKSKGSSTYASLVDWVATVAADCGWEVETEMLRIPSTRNVALIGRRRTRDYGDVDVEGVVKKHGGVEGYLESAMKLLVAGPRKH